MRLCKQSNESDEVLVKSSFLVELQRRVLKAESALRVKDEENDILHQRLQQYENRWFEYEGKMKSMEERLQLGNREYFRSRDSNGVRPVSAGLSVISRLAEEFDQRSQVFGDDAKFLVEVKSGQVDASLNPDRELRRLKQIFEGWKKDYGARLRETKVILNKLGSEEGSGDRLQKKCWGRLNSSRIN
ncbi:myosin-1-like [Apium graveolens]|uniref:myosin-1-like n=1 Tax=Apium graveolens TaxID=4045 RepID=UPI003D7A13C1